MPFANDCLAGLSFLIVDDVPDNSILMKLILRGDGALVSICSSGQEALEMVEKNDFDIILMDLHMPVLDGAETTRRLRDDGFTKPVIAVTATDIEEIKKIEKTQIFDEIIRKPLNRTEFLEDICQYVTKPSVY